MAMFECPGCKHIVDDSIRKCPNCKFDIKKYVKEMQKSGKSIGSTGLKLSSVYNSSNDSNGLPTLDFLSNKPMAAAPEPVAAAVAEPVAAVMPEPVAPVMPEPVAPAMSEPVAPVMPEPVAPVMPEPVAPAVPDASIVSPTPSLGRIQMPEYSVDGQSTIRIPAPMAMAPERKPITSNPASMPEPIQVQPADDYNSQISNQTPVFETPSLNAPMGLNPAAPTPSPMGLNPMAPTPSPMGLNPAAPTPTTTFGTGPAANGLPNYGAAGSMFGQAQVSPRVLPGFGMQANMGVPEEVEDDDDGTEKLFDSPALNKTAKLIAAGKYVPESKATDATMADLEKRTLNAMMSAKVNHKNFGSSFQQQSSYKAPQYQPQYAPQQPNFAPAYGGGMNNGSNVNIPQYGPTGVGAPNPMLAGGAGAPNPMLAQGSRGVGAPNPMLAGYSQPQQ